MYFDVSAALHDLGNVTDRIVELVEWMKLAEQEHRSPFPSALRPADDLGEDLKAWRNSKNASIPPVYKGGSTLDEHRLRFILLR